MLLASSTVLLCLVASAVRAQAAAHSDIVLAVDKESKKQVTFGAGFVLETGINGGTEGGLYPELLANRDFTQVDGWLPVGQGTKISPVIEGTKRQAVTVTGSDAGICGVANNGFHGKLLFTPTAHRVFFSIKGTGAEPVKKSFKAGVYSKIGNRPLLEGTFEIAVTNQWERHAFKLSGKDVMGKIGEPAVFMLQSLDGCGAKGFQLNTVSLFGQTWRGLPIRYDLGEALAALKPAYVRVAAGNDLVGSNFNSFFNWTQSIGFIDERIGRGSSWGGRHLTNGFGLMEQLELTDQLGALPILGIYAGWSFGQVASQSEMPQFVTLALDLLHFCLDDATTTFGQLRARYGRKKPYIIRQVEIGNEDFINPQAKSTYAYRYKAIADAIRQAFPQLEIIATTDVAGATAIDVHRYGQDFSDMYPDARLIPATSSAKNAWMLEYAARGADFPTLGGSLSEAVGLLGMEMTGDTNKGAAYAPVLHYLEDGKKPDWSPSLISFDDLRVTRSTSYYILEGFGKHRIATSFKTKSSVDAHATKLFHSVGLAQNGRDWYVKLVNTDGAPKSVTVQGAGGRIAQTWQLKGADPKASNVLGSEKIVPITASSGGQTITRVGGNLRAELPPFSFTVVTITSDHAEL